MRLVCEMPLGSVVSICECGKDIDSDGYHLLTCKTGGGPIWTRETLASVWSDCLQHLKITHHREPMNRYINSDDRPDIIAFDALSQTLVAPLSLPSQWLIRGRNMSFRRWCSCR